MKIRMRLFMPVFLLVFVMLFVSACSTLRGVAVRYTQEDLQNVEVARQVAQDLLKTWPMKSGIIRGALGSNINKLPVEAVQAMDELDALAEKCGECTDNEYGYSLGLKIRMLGELVQEAIELYAPDVLDLVGVIL